MNDTHLRFYGISNNTCNNNLVILNVILMSLLLNQSSIILGINFSLADLFLGMILTILLIENKLVFPLKQTMFILMVSILVIFSATFYVPLKTTYNPDIFNILTSYIKVLVVFFYFIVGFNLSKLNLLDLILKWFSVGSLIIGIIALVTNFLKVDFLAEILYLDKTRFKGFMNDPNYFAILQLIALAYYLGVNNIHTFYKYSVIFILSISILISGSKTGVLTLIAFTVLKLVQSINRYDKQYKTIVKRITMTTLLLLIIFLLTFNIERTITFIGQYISGFNRVSLIFTDFNSATSSSGSGRDSTWDIAIELVKLSPILGIGVGTYTGIANKIWNFGSIAHNTYLQLVVEWGLPLAIIFFTYLLYLMFKITFLPKYQSTINIVLRDMLFIFLFSSLAISLNNARIFWLIIGALVFNISVKRQAKEKNISPLN